MNRDQFLLEVSRRLRLVRTEYALSQDAMAQVLGISKKTLVETEKGRRTLSFPEAAAVVAVFPGSEVLGNAFGGELSDLLRAVAFENADVTYPPTMGGKVWWRAVDDVGGYRIQQNIVSGHYRLLDPADGRMFSSFDLAEVKAYRDSCGIQ